MVAAKSPAPWLSRVVPFSLIGQMKPQHYPEMLRVLWENRKEIPYAWNVLSHGVCDCCSLGPYGLRDNVVDGLHLCMSRLKLLKLNTMEDLDLSALTDVRRLRNMGPEQLRSLGRLSHPMVRRKGERGFLRVSWDEALDVICKHTHSIPPHEIGFIATPRGLTNEVYYVFQKLARVLGTNNVDLCSRLSDTAGVAGLKATLGYAAPTCSLSDFIGTDLLIIFGSDLADNQPVTTKYLYYAKRAGTRIVVVDPTRDPGPERQAAGSNRLGTKLIDDSFRVSVGGNIAFLNGVLKTLIANDQIEYTFIGKHTAGFDDLKNFLERQSWEMLEQASGLSRSEMQSFAILYGQARSAVIVYDMGLTQQRESGVDNVKAVVNLALARGMLGREKCGIMPMRSQSGVQGGGECGSEPDKFPGGFSVGEGTARRFSNLWHHPVPSNPGLKALQMVEAAHSGEIKFLYSIGGNLFEITPDANFVADALGRLPVRVHQDTVLNPSMLLDPGDAVVLLPGQTRYEQKSGGTSTSTERRIRFTPEIPGHKIGETLPDWEILGLIGRKSMPNCDKLFPFGNTQAIREEMSRVMPLYQGIETLTEEGDHIQWGGAQLYRDGFTAMPNNRARFTPLEPPDLTTIEKEFDLTGRRGEPISRIASAAPNEWLKKP
jgi:molybdopterin-dependent oxidoreductase alpha subunit